MKFQLIIDLNIGAFPEDPERADKGEVDDIPEDSSEEGREHIVNSLQDRVGEAIAESRGLMGRQVVVGGYRINLVV